MKTVLAATLAVLGVLAGAGSASARESPPALHARSAIVMEASTGDVALARLADDRRSIASTTKLMTALLTLERSDLSDVLRAVNYHASPLESTIGLLPGEHMTVRDLLRALLLPSANDAAATLATGVAGSRKAFVRLMNREAAQMHLTRTHYENPIGLDDPLNFSTARDLAHLAIRLRQFAFFRDTVDLGSATLRSGAHPRTVINRNDLVRGYDWINGVKTGNTSHAGHVLVASATRHGVTVVSVVLGEPNERLRDQDSLALLRYGLAQYRETTPLEVGAVLARPHLRYRGDDSVEVVAARSVRRVVRRGDPARVTIRGVPHKLDGPLARGAPVGTALVSQDGKVVERVPLVTAHAVSEAGLGDRLDDMLHKTITALALLALVACSLPLVLLRRRAVRRKRDTEERTRRASRREETPVA